MQILSYTEFYELTNLLELRTTEAIIEVKVQIFFLPFLYQIYTVIRVSDKNTNREDNYSV